MHNSLQSSSRIYMCERYARPQCTVQHVCARWMHECQARHVYRPVISYNRRMCEINYTTSCQLLHAVQSFCLTTDAAGDITLQPSADSSRAVPWAHVESAFTACTAMQACLVRQSSTDMKSRTWSQYQVQHKHQQLSVLNTAGTDLTKKHFPILH